MTISPQPTHVAAFNLSITKALADQLAEKLAPLRPHPLTEQALGALERRPGVYLLYHLDHRVYVGKAQQPLPVRLRQHLKKLSGREGIGLEDVKFVCLYVDEDLDAVAPETLLIRRYRAEGGEDGVPWNVNGFGNKDPGRNRDTSAVEANHFDARFPARLDWPLPDLPAGQQVLGDVLKAAKAQLPYLLRFANAKKSAPVRRSYAGEITVPATPISARDLIVAVVGALPVGWQATALPGYVILYPAEEEFPSARYWWRRDGDEVVETDQQMRLAPAALIPDETEGLAVDEDSAE